MMNCAHVRCVTPRLMSVVAAVFALTFFVTVSAQAQTTSGDGAVAPAPAPAREVAPPAPVLDLRRALAAVRDGSLAVPERTSPLAASPVQSQPKPSSHRLMWGTIGALVGVGIGFVALGSQKEGLLPVLVPLVSAGGGFAAGFLIGR